jgi:hypothetical protein
MNLSIRLIAAAALAAALPAVAAPSAAEPDRAPLLWDCARAGAPSAAEVVNHFGVRNLHKVHATQVHLRTVALRACADGASSLHIVARPAADGSLRFAAVAAR